MPKNVKGAPLGVFEHPFFAAKKSLTKPKEPEQKNGQGRDSNPRPSAWQILKKPNQPLCQVPVEKGHSLVLVQVSL